MQYSESAKDMHLADPTTTTTTPAPTTRRSDSCDGAQVSIGKFTGGNPKLDNSCVETDDPSDATSCCCNSCARDHACTAWSVRVTSVPVNTGKRSVGDNALCNIFTEDRDTLELSADPADGYQNWNSGNASGDTVCYVLHT